MECRAEFTHRLVNIILFPEQVSPALIRSLPELFESYRQHTKKINFPVSLPVLSKSCYPYSHTAIQRSEHAGLLHFCSVSLNPGTYHFHRPMQSSFSIRLADEIFFYTHTYFIAVCSKFTGSNYELCSPTNDNIGRILTETWFKQQLFGPKSVEFLHC